MGKLLSVREWAAVRDAGWPGWEMGRADDTLMERFVGADRCGGHAYVPGGASVPLGITVERSPPYAAGEDRISELRRWCRHHARGQAHVASWDPWARGFFQFRDDAAVFRLSFG